MRKSDLLDAKTVLNAKLKAAPYKLVDGKGMYLLVNADGSKYWRLRYRFNGKETVLGLGVYNDGGVSLKMAREKRDIARKLLADGKNPSAERKAQKRAAIISAENSFEAVAREYLKKNGNGLSEGYEKHKRRRLELNVFPYLGKRPIAEIDGPELLQVLREIEKRGAYDQTHRVMQICGQVFCYGVSTDRCSRDITVDLRKALTKHKSANMPAIRYKELPDLLVAIDAYQGEPQTRYGLQLLALLFTRTSELIKAEWTEFDFKEAVWTIPAGRMKKRLEHLVPLPKQAIAILLELKKFSGDGKRVFPAATKSGHMSNNTMLKALERMGYKGRMSGHGFRAVARTTIKELGSRGRHQFTNDAAEIQLAHRKKDKTGRAYDRAELLPERTDMLQWWADYLDELRATQAAKAA